MSVENGLRTWIDNSQEENYKQLISILKGMHSLIMRENANHYNKGAFSFGSKLTKGYSIMISRASLVGVGHDGNWCWENGISTFLPRFNILQRGYNLWLSNSASKDRRRQNHGSLCQIFGLMDKDINHDGISKINVSQPQRYWRLGSNN